MKANILKSAKNLAIVIPRKTAKAAGLHEGDTVELTFIQEGGKVSCCVSKNPTLAELVARITPENRHDEIVFSTSVGNESEPC